MYVRVRDKSTGHEFDVSETSSLLARGVVERVKSDRYPTARHPRPAKHRKNLRGRPAEQEAPTLSVGGDDTSPDLPEEAS